MRIGIVPSLKASSGGVYQYSLTMLHALAEWRRKGCEDRFMAFTNGASPGVLDSIRKAGLEVGRLEPSRVLHAARSLYLRLEGRIPFADSVIRARNAIVRNKGRRTPGGVSVRPDLADWFRRWDIGLMIYPNPTHLSFEAGVPYIMAIHDLQHRLQPEFPEVSADGEWEWREYLFGNGTRRATLILADSETGKEDILNCYGPDGITEDRVRVLPFLPASTLPVGISEEDRKRVREKYRLPGRYVFYPAQFWPHKNHVRLMQALALLRKTKGIRIPIVLCGSSTGKIREGVLDEIRGIVRSNAMEEDVRLFGYLPDPDVGALYAEAAGLVMPTFFGPTNIPILEAWAFSCPVLTSDIRGIREQVGDAAILVDPRSVESMADGIARLWEDGALGQQLREAGRIRLAGFTPEDFEKRLAAILTEAKKRIRSAA